MTKSPYFETSYGRKLYPIEGYRQLHQKYAIASSHLSSADNPPDNSTIVYKGFRKDVFLYGMMLDFLESIGVDTQWSRMLDVGGAEGTMARLCKLEGRVGFAQVIDLHDMRDKLPDRVFWRYLLRLKRDIVLVRLGVANKARLGDSNAYRYLNFFPSKSSHYFNIKLRRAPTIDAFTIGDYYELDKTYDLLTTFSCIDYFYPPDFFKQAAKLLEPGGIFYGYLAYWWFPVNCSLVYGDFPYAAQRLSKDDFTRYLEEFHPDLRDNMLRLYNYFHHGRVHPVLDDYIEYAENAGLKLLGCRRLMPSGGPLKITPFTPEEMDQHSDDVLTEVLEDINQFNPRVRPADLRTFGILLAFQKPHKSDQLFADRVGDVWRNSVRNQSPIEPSDHG